MLSVTDAATEIQDTSLVDAVAASEAVLRSRLEQLRNQSGSVSSSDMFEMQRLMNQLTQLSDMSASVIAASHSAISSMARNVKQ